MLYNFKSDRSGMSRSDESVSVESGDWVSGDESKDKSGIESVESDDATSLSLSGKTCVVTKLNRTQSKPYY